MSEFQITKDSYLAFDAYTLRQHIINALNKSGHFTDQNYEGSYISTIIEIISYMFHVLMFYLNKTSTESMFTEAQLYENINRIVKMLDYKPMGMSSAVLSFTLNASEGLRSGSYTIPRYSTVQARGVPYSFIDDVSFVKTKPDAEMLNRIGENVLLHQGIWREYSLYTANGEPNEIAYLIPGENVLIDHNNIHVYVKSDNDKWEPWEKTISLYLENGFDKKFETRLNEKKQYEIKFGNNINGLRLNKDDEVAIYYLESRGTAGEVGVGAINNQKMASFKSSRFQEILKDISQITNTMYINDSDLNKLTFFNSSISTYASMHENVESIRQNAPATFRSQFRLVTSDDYENFIKTNFNQLIHDARVLNNWSYVTEYLKYFYDLGITNPNNLSRALFNQVNFADACNFNNVYLFLIPKTLPISDTDIIYLTPANKQLIISSINSIKTMTSEIVIMDPIYIAYRICAPKVQGTLTLNDANDTKLEIIKNQYSRRDDDSIRQDVIEIFELYFRKQDIQFGQNIDVTQLTADILSVDGVDKIYTHNVQTKDRIEGLSLIEWNPIYSTNKPEILLSNKNLSSFMFPVWAEENISNKIEIISSIRIFENVEY